MSRCLDLGLVLLASLDLTEVLVTWEFWFAEPWPLSAVLVDWDSAGPGIYRYGGLELCVLSLPVYKYIITVVPSCSFTECPAFWVSGADWPSVHTHLTLRQDKEGAPSNSTQTQATKLV